VPVALASPSRPERPSTRDIGMAIVLYHLPTGEQDCGVIMRTRRRMQRGVQYGHDPLELSSVYSKLWIQAVLLIRCESDKGPDLKHNPAEETMCHVSSSGE